ncbi:MAG: IS1 family transposase, partial [Candidatus Deianiraeaceae bacterium]
KRFINFVIGDRSANTGKALWNNIKDKKIDYFMTDHWRSYNTLNQRQKLLQSRVIILYSDIFYLE